MSQLNDEEKALVMWNNLMKAVFSIPGVRVNRKEFIKNNFSKYVDEDTINKAIENGTWNAGIPKEIMDKIADSVIALHTTMVTGTSTLAGIPGGLAILGTIPADITQFYYHVIQVAQKLAYTYGWGDFGEEISDEYIMLVTLFIGIMSGAEAANVVIREIAKNLAKEIAKRLPREALTKYGFYNVAKQIAKWLGISLTKTTFSRSLSKIIPIIGGVISGTISLATFLPMCSKLKNYLRNLPIVENNNEKLEGKKSVLIDGIIVDDK